jgi:hypothetical protein
VEVRPTSRAAIEAEYMGTLLVVILAFLENLTGRFLCNTIIEAGVYFKYNKERPHKTNGVFHRFIQHPICRSLSYRASPIPPQNNPNQSS